MLMTARPLRCISRLIFQFLFVVRWKNCLFELNKKFHSKSECFATPFKLKIWKADDFFSPFNSLWYIFVSPNLGRFIYLDFIYLLYVYTPKIRFFILLSPHNFPWTLILRIPTKCGCSRPKLGVASFFWSFGQRKGKQKQKILSGLLAIELEMYTWIVITNLQIHLRHRTSSLI